MRDFTPTELETVKRMAASGATLAQTRRAIKIAPHNFADNIKALGLEFAPPLPAGPKLREWTAEEIAIIEREAKAGTCAEQTRKLIGCGIVTLLRFADQRGITFKPASKARCPRFTLTAEQDIKFRAMVEAGERRSVISKAFGVSFSTIGRLCTDRGISLREQMNKRASNVTQSRKPRIRSKVEVKAKWRNPLKDLSTWRPIADLTTLDRAVSALRTIHCPVHAEETASKPYKTPKAYGPETLFRVGAMQNVTAEQVLAMAGQMGRAA